MQPLQLMTVKKNLYGALSKSLHYIACDDVTWHLLPNLSLLLTSPESLSF